jgi:toluene monooxygenase system ferredoxin subunit
MAFARLCKLADLVQGKSAAFTVEGHDILLLWPRKGALTAFQGTCPHQQISLADALFDGETLMCQAHRWVFNAHTGQAAAPHFCQLARYALRIEAGDVLVDVTAKAPSEK